MLVIACPHCRTKLEGRDAVLGKEVICGQCHKRFIAAAMIPFGSQHARPEPPEHQQDSRQDSRQGGPVSTESQIGHPAKVAEHSSAQVPRQPHPPGPHPQPGPPQVLEEADAESMKPLAPSPARPYAPAKPPSPAKTSALVNPPAAARPPRSAQAPAQPMAGPLAPPPPSVPLRNEPPRTPRIGRAPTPGKPIGYRAPGAALPESPLVGMTLVLGIFAIIGAWGCWGIVGLVCGPLAIMFGNAALKGIDSGRFAVSDRGKASLGRNLGILALAISILTLILAVSRVSVR